MNQKNVLVEHLGNINTVIKQPLQFTQRIKFTSFDVSQSYIIFGATSGGLYIFNRYPYAFIKLIPSKEGALVQVCISPNEKAIALASSKGSIIVVQNYMTETNVQFQVFTEHSGNLITAMKWNMDDLYCGDNKGTVSVVMIPSSLTKAIFQTPSASLMKLDSNIVQIDAYSKFLVISTLTRTYLCDTDKEQYRQIGKKMRDGNFGACFFTNDVDPEITSIQHSASRGLFKKAIDDEQFIAHMNDNIKIFCARPSARLWEAKLDASVTHTHQFRNSFKRESTNVIQLDDTAEARLIINKHLDIHFTTLDFSKVFMLGKQYIFSFHREGFYIFNPNTTVIICWCNCYNNIQDVKVVKNFIYIWDEDFKLHVLAVYDLEKIILKTLFTKQYCACAELCINYTKDLLELIETSEKIHLILVLKEKIDQNLLEQLMPILKAIKEFSNKNFDIQKLTSGIVVVNNTFLEKNSMDDSKNRYEKDQQFPETLQVLKDIGTNVTEKITERTKNLKEKWQILETTVKNLTLNDYNLSKSFNENPKETLKTEPSELIDVELGNSESDSNLKAFLKQYQLSKINGNLESSEFFKLLETNNVNSNVKLFYDFLEYAKNKKENEEYVKLWCYRQYLKYLMKIDFENNENFKLQEPAIIFASDAFYAVNSLHGDSCDCIYPLPSAKTKSPDYYKIGCVLAKKFWKYKPDLLQNMYRQVPFMWKYIIKELICNDDISDLLPLLIQYGDEDLIAIFLCKFKYDIWDDAIKLLIKLKDGTCLNCDNKFETVCDIMKWSNFGTLMVQSIGGPSSIKLFSRYSNVIPSNELDENFYQSCIFATAIDNFRDGFRDRAINFTKVIQANDDTEPLFNKMMIQFLQTSYLKRPMKNAKKTDFKCAFCDLPFDIPFVESKNDLNCKHLYHVLCLKYNKNICTKCKSM